MCWRKVPKTFITLEDPSIYTVGCREQTTLVYMQSSNKICDRLWGHRAWLSVKKHAYPPNTIHREELRLCSGVFQTSLISILYASKTAVLPDNVAHQVVFAPKHIELFQSRQTTIPCFGIWFKQQLKSTHSSPTKVEEITLGFLPWTDNPGKLSWSCSTSGELCQM